MSIVRDCKGSVLATMRKNVPQFPDALLAQYVGS